MSEKKLWLNNIKNVRKSIARLTREYHDGQTAEDNKYHRMLIAYLSLLISALKLETDLDIQRQIDEIRDRLDMKGGY